MSLIRPKAPILIFVAICLNLFVAIAIPNFVVPPPLGEQRGKAILNLALCVMPAFYSICLIICIRERVASIIGCTALIPALGWVIYALSIAIEAFA